MQPLNRRRFLTGLLGSLAQAAGVVVVANARADASSKKAEDSPAPAADLQQRADRLAESLSAEDPSSAVNAFLNGGFRNTPVGAFRNAPLGAFRNTPIGAFRNTPLAGFRNTPLGSAFGNGGWPNGLPGAFRNGGWPNVGWRNFW